MLDRVRQFGSVITVKRKSRSELPADFSGCADEGAREIVLPNDLSKDADIETVAHEYYEIAHDRLSLGLSHSQLSAVAVLAVAVLAVEFSKQLKKEELGKENKGNNKGLKR